MQKILPEGFPVLRFPFVLLFQIFQGHDGYLPFSLAILLSLWDDYENLCFRLNSLINFVLHIQRYQLYQMLHFVIYIKNAQRICNLLVTFMLFLQNLSISLDKKSRFLADFAYCNSRCYVL